MQIMHSFYTTPISGYIKRFDKKCSKFLPKLTSPIGVSQKFPKIIFLAHKRIKPD